MLLSAWRLAGFLNCNQHSLLHHNQCCLLLRSLWHRTLAPRREPVDLSLVVVLVLASLPSHGARSLRSMEAVAVAVLAVALSLAVTTWASVDLVLASLPSHEARSLRSMEAVAVLAVALSLAVTTWASADLAVVVDVLALNPLGDGGGDDKLVFFR